ncbi:MAG: hypothetical protein IVW57_14910, partial [Ktedonobacterales bacterium]|nr:hypothetical protein [Ktedonobacterales bacterium]
MHDEITEPDLRLPDLPVRRARTSARHGHTWGNQLARVLLVTLFLLGAVASLTPWGRAATRGMMLLPALVAASQLPPIVASGEPIRHTAPTVPSQGGSVSLDVYEPTATPPAVPGAREGVLIIPGVGDERREPQLINLSESLARAGLVAMEMTTPALINYTLAPVDSDAVVQAFQALQRWHGVGASRVGILGFSAGDALASLAAADPRIQRA